MSASIKMYKTRQIVQHDIPVVLPSCMYKMKSIHVPRNDIEQTLDHVSSPTKKLDLFDQNNQQIPGMAELEAKQKRILEQLAELRKQMQQIKSNLKITNAAPTATLSTTVCPAKATPTSFPDIVINASPSYPPYSLAILQKIWKDDIQLSITTHLHSTVSELTEQSKMLSTKLESSSVRPNVPKMCIRLIWKDVGYDMELLVSQIPIIGEVNILRYFTRLSNSLNYSADIDSLKMDSLLDVCYLLVRSKTKTERASLLQILNKSLEKSHWLVGKNQMSILDIAAFSALKQIPVNEVNANLSKWLQRCDAA